MHYRLNGRLKHVTPEQVILFIGMFSFAIFIWVAGFILYLIAAGRSAPDFIVALIATPEPGFTLPATWTPTPDPGFVPTVVATPVYDGQTPTRIYTPRPTSLPGVKLYYNLLTPSLTVIDLARIMEGESRFDKEAAYRVGWVAKNRLQHASYGDTYALVSRGFFGYRVVPEPSEEFIQLARRVIRSKEDPTGGCLFALSRTDIHNLGVPPSRADVTYGEWFFFKTWPVR